MKLLETIVIVGLMIGGCVMIVSKIFNSLERGRKDNERKEKTTKNDRKGNESKKRQEPDYGKVFDNNYEKILRELFAIFEDKKGMSEFQRDLKDCFVAWKEMIELQKEEKRANIILEGFYASEKIKSVFEEFCEYVKEDMEEEESSEMLVIAGYNSCMNLAYMDYKKMKKRLENICEEQVSKADKDLLTGFLHMLSCKGEFFSDLYRVYISGQKRKNGEIIRESDKEIYYLAKEVVKKMKDYSLGENDITILEITEEIGLQKEKIEKNLKKAEKLQEALANILNEENMQLLKTKEMDMQELKEAYIKIEKLVKEVLDYDA